MSVRVLLPYSALRLDLDRHDRERLLVRGHRRADVERVFKGVWILDRPDRAYRYRAHVPWGMALRQFGRLTVDALTNANAAVASPARRAAEAKADAAFAAWGDGAPLPERLPVLRGDRSATLKPSGWKSEPSPAVTETALPLHLPLTGEEIARLRLGFLPEVMEDKWHIFYEEPWVYAARSWTGMPVARFRIAGAGFDEARVTVIGGEEEDAAARLAGALAAVALLAGRDPDLGPDPLAAWHVHGHVVVGRLPEPGIAPSKFAPKG